MTIDATEIARLREEVHKRAYAAWVLDLLDELEKARERDLLRNELDVLSASHKDLAHRLAIAGEERDFARALLGEARMQLASVADPNLRTRIAQLIGDA